MSYGKEVKSAKGVGQKRESDNKAYDRSNINFEGTRQRKDKKEWSSRAFGDKGRNRAYR